MKKFYFDMDGVLADFDGQPNALDRFITEERFFQILKPTKLVAKINELLENPVAREMICILSASPNENADRDKMFWLWEHMPNLKLENINIIRGGQGADERKAFFANEESILFDDYSGNLITWTEKGGLAVKVINGKNGKGIKWQGARLIVEK